MLFLSVVALTAGCGTRNPPKTEGNSPKPAKSITSPPPGYAQNSVDVPKFANKSAEEVEKLFGPPEKITPATVVSEVPGDYRLYRISGHSKGLSVRYFREKAVRFNLLLGTPEKSAQEALLKFFKIDVSKMAPVSGESLSVIWKGESNGTLFTTAYAKREKPGSDFVMIHAEVKQ